MFQQKPPNKVVLTRDNLDDWPSFQKLHDEGKVKFDNAGRLRYLHGAPVGDMLLSQVNEDGKAIYKESAEEWFDPGSPLADSFEWS